MYYKKYIDGVWGINSTHALSSDYYFSQDYQDILLESFKTTEYRVVRETWDDDAKKRKLTFHFVYPLMQLCDALYYKPKVIFAEQSQERIYRILPLIAEQLGIDLSGSYIIYIR